MLACGKLQRVSKDTNNRTHQVTHTYLQTLLISWLWEMYAIIFDPDPLRLAQTLPTVQPLNKLVHGVALKCM